mmetsp:Transcript_27051/g.68434  ORF Transcript_27051/g.68434 Transcript_27051/m.68434 type:complete len:227 (-) Transcript_27051:336-1016(-)
MRSAANERRLDANAELSHVDLDPAAALTVGLILDLGLIAARKPSEVTASSARRKNAAPATTALRAPPPTSTDTTAIAAAVVSADSLKVFLGLESVKLMTPRMKRNERTAMTISAKMRNATSPTTRSGNAKSPTSTNAPAMAVTVFTVLTDFSVLATSSATPLAVPAGVDLAPNDAMRPNVVVITSSASTNCAVSESVPVMMAEKKASATTRKGACPSGGMPAEARS